ncbi:class I SAM-dependent methyltransferase (plasmid) [Embleya sp. NBC_00888]|uniref:class I SAM-dependent DNA methyltransferase n=1 Tax=Embleya sp. NBC_00888 TaxID=2975960 RepID=UPI002F912643|nr:class I SAM-dependent methyltransferase [Embleya sp. NBC_00888]
MIEPDFLSATRMSYDAVAGEYTDYVRTELASKPVDRAQLAAFAELVRASGAEAGPVADVGCGPGRVTAHLRDLGVETFGIDLSPQMIAVARREYPDLRFEVGTMTDLDLPDAGLGGLVAWYSTIHVPIAELPAVFAGFHRVLAPGGYLLLAFQVGDEPLSMTEAFGRSVNLDFHRRRPDVIADLVTAAGLAMQARTIREPIAGESVRPCPQAFLLARKPPAAGAS